MELGFDDLAVLGEARARGADDVELYVETMVEHVVQVHAGRVESQSQTRSRGLGVRALAGGRPGFAYTTDLEPRVVLATVEEALANARLLQPDPCLALPGPAQAAVEADRFYAPALAGIPMEDKVALALDAEQRAWRCDPRVDSVPQVLYSDETHEVAIVNSRGVRVSFQLSMVTLQVGLVMKASGQVQSGNGYGYGRLPSELDLDGAVAQAREEAAAMLGGRPVPSARAPVVFSPRAGAMLLAIVARAVTGDAVRKGRSFFPSQAGAEVASPLVTLVDDGLLPQGHSSAPFDDEGTPCRRVEVVKDGILASLLLDTRSGKRVGRPSTGNARRTSFRNPPEAGSTNFYMAAGQDDPQAVVAGAKEGLYLMDLTGMTVGGANPATGDLSVAAGGRCIRGGRLQRPVREVTISGNLSALLKDVDAVGRDLEFMPLDGFWGSPTFRVKGLVVSGT